VLLLYAAWGANKLSIYSTAKIKALADVRPIAIDDADSIIRSFHLTLPNTDGHPHVEPPEAAAIVNGA
jgi:homocitrate synthase